MAMINQELLREILHYCPDTGVFTWKLRPNAGRKNKHFNSIWGGKRAGHEERTPSGASYWYICIEGRKVLAHRAAYIYMTGSSPDEIDHIDRNGTNNEWGNLRGSSRAENMLNKTLYRNSTSGITGVTWHKGQKKWSARVQINNKRKTIGSFDTKEDAFKAVLEARKSLGFSCGHGSPREKTGTTEHGLDDRRARYNRLV